MAFVFFRILELRSSMARTARSATLTPMARRLQSVAVIVRVYGSSWKDKCTVQLHCSRLG